jgi:hypothetical protein
MIDVPHRYYLFGTGLLVRLDLKRDRILIATWVALLTATCYASAAATAALYPTVSDQVSAARAINSSGAIVALYGPVLDPHSLGELAMTKMTVLYAVLVAVMCLVVIRRHTRTEEESGRTELVGGTARGGGGGGFVGQRRPRLSRCGGQPGRWAPDRRVTVVRRVLGRDRVGSSWSQRGRVPVVREQSHLRGVRGCSDSRDVRAAGSRRHVLGLMAQLALAVRLVHPAQGLVISPAVGAVALPGPDRRARR